MAVYESEGEGTQEFVTVVLPRAAGQRPARVLGLMPGAAAHFLEVEGGEARDFVIVGRPGALVSEQRFTTDFAWTWARVGADGRLLEVVLVGGGRRFEYAGREVLSAAAPLKYAAAWAAGGGVLEFESEPGGAGGVNPAAAGADLVFDGGAFGPRDNLSKAGRDAAAGGASGRPAHTPRPGPGH